MRFNLYSVEETEVYIRAIMTESLNAMVTNGENVHIFSHMTERMNASAYASAGEIFSTTLAEALGSEVVGAAQYKFEAVFKEGLFANVQPSENVHIEAAMSEAIMASAFIGSDEHLTLVMAEAIMSEVFASADYYVQPITMYVSFGSMVTSYRFDVTYIEVSVAIPPGGTLVIDSDNYVVLLNGENVIDKHSGAWLDELTRNTFDVQIEGAGSGGLEGSILYTPRYL